MGKQGIFILLALLLVCGGVWGALNQPSLAPEVTSEVVNDVPATASHAQRALRNLETVLKREGTIEISIGNGATDRYSSKVVKLTDGWLIIETLKEMIMSNGKISPSQSITRTSFPLAFLDSDRLEVKGWPNHSVHSLEIETLPLSFDSEWIEVQVEPVGRMKQGQPRIISSSRIRFRSEGGAEEAREAIKILIEAYQQKKAKGAHAK